MENGGTILGSYGNLSNPQNVGTTNGIDPYDGSAMLSISESPLGGTPQAYISFIENLFVYGQFHRLIPLQTYLRGFKICEIKIKNNARKHGVSKYRAFRYQGAFDLFSLLFTVKHSFTPLHFFGPISFLFLVPGFFVFCYLTFSHFSALGFQDYDILVSRPLLDMSLTTMLAGLIILMTGFVCDFILYHHLRFNSKMITQNTVSGIIESKRKK